MKKNRATSLFEGFKKFITKGNVIDMAIGVIVGGAFSAIITAITQHILMPIITWAIPSGGIEGLVTVLNGDAAKVTSSTVNVVSYWGTQYDADVVNVINWGSLLNAIIYFLAVAVLLFTILKVFTYLKKKRADLAAIELEKYYQKHPEERPKVEAPAAPKPTELDILIEIRDQLKKEENK